MQIIPTFKSTLRFQEINRASLRLLAQKKSGRYKEDFKSLLMEYLGTGNIVFVPSARWGLYFILKNLDIPIGAEVIVSAFNYYAVPAAIIRAGMKPVFVDISENGIGIDISKIEQAVTDQTKVLIVTHLCGFVADMEKISAIARKHGLIIIEDCAQAFGAAVGTRKAGSFGDHAFFTFGLTKNFTAFGSGAVVTKNRNLLEMMEHDLSKLQQTSYRRTLLQLFWAYAILFATSRILFPLIYWVIRWLSDFGIDILDRLFRENEALMGKLPDSGCLNDVQASVGITQLSSVDERNILRGQKGLKLYNALKNTENITLPNIIAQAKNIFISCPVLVKDREKIRACLLKQGIVTSFGFMRNCSNFKLFSRYRSACVNAERASREIIYLPLYDSITDEEIDFVAEHIRKCLS